MWPILFDLRPIDYDIWSMKCDLWPILSDLWPIYIYLWTMEQTYDLVMWTVTYQTKCGLSLMNCKHDLWPQPQPTHQQKNHKPYGGTTITAIAKITDDHQ